MITAMEGSLPPHRPPWLFRLRLSALLGALVAVIIAAQFVQRLPIRELLLAIGVLAVLYTLIEIYLAGREEARLSERLRSAGVAIPVILDIAGLTTILHFSGGAENPFFPFYAFSVILASALLTRRAAFAIAGLSSALYAGLLVAEALGYLPHYHLANLQDASLYRRPVFLIAQGLSLTTVCFLAAQATSVLVGQARARARELEESNRRAETRAAHMRELNEQLRAANEECRHSREHLDALYLEMQIAFERLEARSRNMSELNEQLRAANAECKSRREELVEVNSKLQEAYRRLESRSENMRELNEQLRLANEECRARRDELGELNRQLAYANAKLRELDDARSQFTLLVTHELRAPVAAIQSYLKLILEGYVPEPKVRETLEKAERRAMEQLALIADLLELGRIQSADAHGLVKPVQVEKLLLEQLDLLAARAQERGITINTDVGAELPPVSSNPEQIKSLWNNLISNALKYNREGGQVHITLRKEGRRLVGSVSDTGIGIPPDAMPKLFSEFFRAENAKAVSRMGTGLGLSIVKEIIERSGGRITAESELNKGTTFHFWLPVIEEKVSVAPSVTNDQTSADTQ